MSYFVVAMVATDEEGELTMALEPIHAPLEDKGSPLTADRREALSAVIFKPKDKRASAWQYAYRDPLGDFHEAVVDAVTGTISAPGLIKRLDGSGEPAVVLPIGSIPITGSLSRDLLRLLDVYGMKAVCGPDGRWEFIHISTNAS